MRQITKKVFFIVVSFAAMLSNVRAQPDSWGETGGRTGNGKTGFTSTEGPAADAEGNIYFADVPANRIHNLDAERESRSHSQQGGYRSKWMPWGSVSRDQHSNRLFA